MINFEVIAPDDFYNLDEKDQEKYIKDIKEEIEKSDNAVIKKMENIVKRNVKHYQNDFYVHDLHMIKNNPGQFIWMTRETGTDFIPLGSVDEVLLSWYNAIKYTNEKFYHYDGKRLKKIPFEKMEKVVSKHKKVLD